MKVKKLTIHPSTTPRITSWVSDDGNIFRIYDGRGNYTEFFAGGGSGQPTLITTNDERVNITGSGTYNVNIDTTGITGETSDLPPLPTNSTKLGHYVLFQDLNGNWKWDVEPTLAASSYTLDENGDLNEMTFKIYGNMENEWKIVSSSLIRDIIGNYDSSANATVYIITSDLLMYGWKQMLMNGLFWQDVSVSQGHLHVVPLPWFPQTIVDDFSLKSILNFGNTIDKEQTIKWTKENSDTVELLSLQDYGTLEQVEVGDIETPLLLKHSAVASDGTLIGNNIMVHYNDDSGFQHQDYVAYRTEVDAENTRAVIAEGNIAAEVGEEEIRAQAVEGEINTTLTSHIANTDIHFFENEKQQMTSQITQNTQDISSIQNGIYRLPPIDQDFTNFSDQEIQDFLNNNSPATKKNGFTIKNLNDNNLWVYNLDSTKWYNQGTDSSNVFSNDAAGVIRGSSLDGQVYANTDGTGAINGWDALKAQVASIANFLYPIGSIYLSTSNINPTTIFSGTWERYANGKVLVGVDENDTTINNSNISVGSTNPLTSHTHTQNSHTHTSAAHTHTSAAHTHTSAAHTHTQVSHSHTIKALTNPATGGTVTDGAASSINGWQTATSSVAPTINSTTPPATGSTTPGNTGSTTPGATGGTTATNYATGDNTNHNNWQPSISCFIWRRIA